ncbi:MAG: alpha-L-fucosidase [bacterium]
MKTTDHLKWFTESRLGMFIHWGIYSQQRNGEWVMNADEISVQDYRVLAEQFTAENLDVDAWVRTAKNTGMKYMVLTTKHHDGFCLWDTDTTDFNAVKTGPRRDVVRDFVDACNRHDIRVGLYWSWVDWNYPEWAEKFVWSDLNLWRQPFDDAAAHNRMIDYLHAQVRELMTNYGKIDVFWFDGGFLTAEQYRSRELVDEMRRLQPAILINDRAGFPGDFGNPEGLMPTDGSDRAWELCHCSAAFTTWTAPIDDPALFASPLELLGLLSDAAGLGGNFLLNFGPQADGTLSKYSIEQLDVIGKWMQLNGDAIYQTQAGPTGRQEWGVSTQSGNTVYLHIFRPASQLAVRGFETSVKSAIILSTGEPVHFVQNGMSLIIDLPAADILPQVVALEFDESLQFIPQAICQQIEKSILLTANHAKLKTIHADNKPILFLSPDALGGRIIGWSRIVDSVEWTFKVEHAGRYQSSFEFNNPESLNVYGRRFEMTVSGQKLRASVPLSGRHGRFDWYTMAGAFNLSPGVHTLTIKPYILDPGILMNLRAVSLKPLN